MNQFELNKSTLKKAWNGASQNWFSLSTYKICDAKEMSVFDRPHNISQSAYFISLGYIPYFTVSDEEVVKAYIAVIDNKKLREALSALDSDKRVEAFWKYTNVYPQLAQGFSDFEDEYVLNKAERWCKENNINYVIK